jgi:ABC-type multidrug transport system ATPase subunit
LCAAPGQTLLIVGENASGKSTLLNILCGELKADAGLGSFEGKDVFLSNGSTNPDDPCCDTHPNEQSSYARKHIGVCPERGGLDDDLTPWLLFQYLADLRCLREDLHREQHIQFLLRALGLWQRRHVPCRNLSSGEHKRVSVGLAMVGWPKAILLDLPSNLDPISRRYLYTAISCAPTHENISWVISTQHVEEAHFLGTHAAILRHGRMLWNGAISNRSDIELMKGAVILTIVKHSPMSKNTRNVRRVWGRNGVQENNATTAELPGYESAVAFVMDNFAPIQIVYTTNCANCYAIGSTATQNRNMNYKNTNNNSNNDDDNNNNNTMMTPRNTSFSKPPSQQQQTKNNNNRNLEHFVDVPSVQTVVGKLIEFQKETGCQFRFSCRMASIEDALLMADRQAPEHSDLQLPVRF